MKPSGLLVLAIGLFATVARAQPPQVPAQGVPRVAIEESGEFASGISFPVTVRIIAPAIDGALDGRLARYTDRKLPLWISVKGPATVAATEPWRVALHDMLARHSARIAILEVDPGSDVQLAAFALRLASTEARSARDEIKVALAPAADMSAEALTRFYSTDLAPYVDLLTLPAHTDRSLISAQLSNVDPDARIAIVDEPWTGMLDDASRHLIDLHLETLGTNVAIVSSQASPVFAARSTLATMAPLLNGDLVTLDDAAAGLSLSIDGRVVTSSLRHRLLFDNRTFTTFFVYWGDADGTLDVEMTSPVEGQPGVYRLDRGGRVQLIDYSRNAATGLVRLKVPLATAPTMVDFNEGATAVFAERTDVSASRMLSVQEIIARHQQQQRAQDLVVRNYTASARSSQHFRPTMTDPGYDVVTDNRYYVAADGIEWEELTFSVNGSKWGADRPPFPMLQPEKVLSLPLQLRFGNDYSYRLAGTERVGEYDCYIVRFDPAASSSSLYRGTVWIDRKIFARVKVQAVQTGLSAPVVSNEEIQTYAPIATIGNRPIFLFSGLDARQIIMIAGRNILLEKKVAFSDFRVNDAGFEEARTTARRGSGIMYRETDRGLRSYVKQGDTRVVSDRATTAARAMAMGVTIDPSYAFPLPIFGINYLNFQFRGRPDTQLAILFAGVLAAGNIQRPKIGGTPFDASVDFFAIAVPSSDRVYEASGEREGERLLTWPLTTGVNLGWQYTPFQKVSAQYQFRFDGYHIDTTTVESFRPPASTVTNGFGGAWEYRRGGYSAVFNGAWYRRVGWRDWGFTPDPASTPTYVKYSAALSRDFFIGPFQKIHVNGAWFGGRDLDRFGKYQFGMFDDTRIHGVPASGVRFEELGMARGSYSFNIFDQYRLDLFLEQAWGRDKALDRAWQPITGIGAAINVRSFWGTILRVDGGKSFLPERYRGVGSATLQVMFLKPLSSR
jgi:hypothetical protein